MTGFDTYRLETAITDFGNLAITGPVAAALLAWIAWRWGLAAAWRFAWPVAFVFAATVVLKMVSRSIGSSVPLGAFALSRGAPSGHMAMATIVFGGPTLMLLRRGLQPAALLIAMFTGAILVGIAVTRVTLHTHTPADVVAGLLLGGLAAIWLVRWLPVPPWVGRREIAELLALGVGVAVLMHLSGYRFDSTTFI